MGNLGLGAKRILRSGFTAFILGCIPIVIFNFLFSYLFFPFLIYSYNPKMSFPVFNFQNITVVTYSLVYSLFILLISLFLSFLSSSFYVIKKRRKRRISISMFLIVLIILYLLCTSDYKLIVYSPLEFSTFGMNWLFAVNITKNSILENNLFIYIMIMELISGITCFLFIILYFSYLSRIKNKLFFTNNR